MAPAKKDTGSETTYPIAAAVFGGFCISATGMFTAVGGHMLKGSAPKFGRFLAVGGTAVMTVAGSVSAVATTYKIYYGLDK